MIKDQIKRLIEKYRQQKTNVIEGEYLSDRIQILFRANNITSYSFSVDLAKDIFLIVVRWNDGKNCEIVSGTWLVKGE